MGCFLRCFGLKDYSRRISLMFSRFFLWKKKEPVEPKNHSSSLLSSKEKAASSKKAKEGIFDDKFYGDDCVYQEQRQEAKLRKTYGAMLDNHVGLYNPLDQHYVADAITSTKVPKTPTDSEEKSKSCQVEDDDDESKKTLLIEKNKDSTTEKELESVILDMSPQIENQMKLHIGDSPPYPTPLNLIDGMQTPGTIYPHKSEIFWTRMQRTEFIHPIKNTFGLKIAGGDNDNDKISNSTAKHNEATRWED